MRHSTIHCHGIDRLIINDEKEKGTNDENGQEQWLMQRVTIWITHIKIKEETEVDAQVVNLVRYGNKLRRRNH